jgi:hypothetical protein
MGDSQPNSPPTVEVSMKDIMRRLEEMSSMMRISFNKIATLEEKIEESREGSQRRGPGSADSNGEEGDLNVLMESLGVEDGTLAMIKDNTLPKQHGIRAQERWKTQSALVSHPSS